MGRSVCRSRRSRQEGTRCCWIGFGHTYLCLVVEASILSLDIVLQLRQGVGLAIVQPQVSKESESGNIRHSGSLTSHTYDRAAR